MLLVYWAPWGTLLVAGCGYLESSGFSLLMMELCAAASSTADIPITTTDAKHITIDIPLLSVNEVCTTKRTAFL